MKKSITLEIMCVVALLLCTLVDSMTIKVNAKEKIEQATEVINSSKKDSVITNEDIFVSKKEVGLGDEIDIKIYYEAEVYISSIKVLYRLPDGKYTLDWLYYNKDEKCFEGSMYIYDDVMSGSWQIAGIEIVKSGENEIIYNSQVFEGAGVDLSNGDFVISGTNKLATTLVDLSTLTVSSDEVHPGEYATITIKPNVDVDEIKTIHVGFDSEYWGNEWYTAEGTSLEYNTSTGLYEGSILITEKTLNGRWYTDSVYVTKQNDEAINYSGVKTNDIDNFGLSAYSSNYNLSEADFTVVDGRVDLDGPTVDLDSISLLNNKLKVGDEINLSMSVTDATGIESVEVSYILPDDEHVYHSKYLSLKLVYNEKSNKFEADYHIPEGTLLGNWECETIVAKDSYGENSIIADSSTAQFPPSAIFADLGAFDITIIEGESDSKPKPPLVDNDDLLIKYNENISFISQDEDSYTLTLNGENIKNVQFAIGEEYVPLEPSGKATTDTLLIYLNAYTEYSETFTVNGEKTNNGQITLKLEEDTNEYHIQLIDYFGEVVREYKVYLMIEEYPELGWYSSQGIWYYYENSKCIRSQWREINKTWYYFDQSGAMQTGWEQIGSTWYFFDQSGAMQTGWEQLGSTWYFFNQSGAMQTGWEQLGSTWYFFNQSGAMQTGWEQLGSTWYFFNQSGAMQTGWEQLGSMWYFFDQSGAMQTGWEKLGSTWYFFDQSGVMATGWIKIDNNWYYLNSSGAMATNTVIDGWIIGGDGVATQS